MLHDRLNKEKKLEEKRKRDMTELKPMEILGKDCAFVNERNVHRAMDRCYLVMQIANMCVQTTLSNHFILNGNTVDRLYQYIREDPSFFNYITIG
jgi:hypothetical protein